MIEVIKALWRVIKALIVLMIVPGIVGYIVAVIYFGWPETETFAGALFGFIGFFISLLIFAVIMEGITKIYQDSKRKHRRRL